MNEDVNRITRTIVYGLVIVSVLSSAYLTIQYMSGEKTRHLVPYAIGGGIGTFVALMVSAAQLHTEAHLKAMLDMANKKTPKTSPDTTHTEPSQSYVHKPRKIIDRPQS